MEHHEKRQVQPGEPAKLRDEIGKVKELEHRRNGLGLTIVQRIIHRRGGKG